MVALFQIGLLTVLIAVVVSARLEYSVDVVDTLPYKDIKGNENGIRHFELINPEAKVKLKKMRNQEDGTGAFAVDTKWKDYRSSIGSFSQSQTFGQCKGRPGIEVTFSTCKKSNVALCCVLPHDCVRTFCFKRLYIDFVENRPGKSYMRVKAKFYEPKTRKRISIEMNPFKPPTEEADKDQATKTNVPHVGSPIPQEALESSPIISAIIGSYDDQHFIGDLAWMKEGLPRAKFSKSRTKGIFRKSKTDYYSAGPVIVDNVKAYDMILDLLAFDTDVHVSEDSEDMSASSSTSLSSVES